MRYEMKLTTKVIKNGSFYDIKIPTDYKAKEQEILKYCHEKRGGYVSLHIRSPKMKRTTGEKSQSHHFNGHVGQIAEYTGYTHDEVKVYIKSIAVSWGYPQEETEEGDVRFDLWGNPVGISEAESSVGECSILIEVAHWLAGQMEIVLDEGKW
jgi:hypothetical protein